VKQQQKIVRLDIQTEKILSKEQKKFNNYLKRIKTIKEQIEATKSFYAQVPAWMQKLKPHQQEQAEAQRKLIFALDANPFLKKLTRNQREDFNTIMTDYCNALISDFGMEDLKPIYEKYNDSDASWDEEEAEMQKEAKEQAAQMAKNMFGMDIDIDKMNNPETQQEEMERVARKMAEMKEKAQQEQEAAENAYQQRQANRKKSPKEIEREQREAEAAKSMTKTTRQVYMELVKTFHPDQEQDETERVKKTAIMQQITAAYEKDDLLQLLELQMTLLNKEEHILQTMNDDSLRLYNKMLGQQVSELEREYHANHPSHNGHPLANYFQFDARGMLSDFMLKKDIKDLQKNTQKMLDMCKHTQVDAKNLKEFIKANKVEPDFDNMFEDFLGGMFR
jgi:hypothetical protein